MTCARCQALEDLLGAAEAALLPVGLRPQGRMIFGLLMRRASVTAEALVTLLYGGRADADWPAHPAVVVRAQVHHLRQVLAPHGIAIACQPGRAGEPTRYGLPPAAKARARTLMAAAAKEAA